MPDPSVRFLLTTEDQEQIGQWLAALNTPQQVALRCRIIQASGEGESETAIAATLQVNRKTVRLWKERFSKSGLKSLWEIATERGRKPVFTAAQVQSVIDATLQTKPEGSTHWSCRTMAAAQKMSKSTVSNLWRSHNLKPHRSKTFKLSRDPKFLEKLTDVVGLYLSPPDKAIVLCVDEKSQIQALNRTQPGLPMKEEGSLRHHDSRLQAQRHDNAVCGPSSARRQSHWGLPFPASAPRILTISTTHQPRVSW